MMLNRAGFIGKVTLAIVVSLASFGNLSAATIEKADNTTNLELGGSWVGGVAPGGGDVALWNSVVTSANISAQGAPSTWLGIQITNPGGPITIANGGTPNATTLTGSLFSGAIANDQLVTLAGTFTGTTGVLAGPSYYVVASDNASTFQLANTLGGAPIDVGGTPPVDVTFTQQFETTLGSAGIDLSNATQNLTVDVPLALSSSQSWNVATGRTLTISGRVNLEPGLAALTVTGAGNTVIGTTSITNNATSNVAIISGNGSLTKNGTGNLTLSAINTYTGGTVVNNGTLTLNMGGAAGAGTSGNLNLLPGTVTVAGGDILTAGGNRLSGTSGNFAFVEVISLLDIQPGFSSFTQTRGSNARVINTFSNVARSVGGTVSLAHPLNANGSANNNGGGYRGPTAANINVDGVVPFMTYTTTSTNTSWFVSVNTGNNGSAYSAFTPSTEFSLGASTQNINVVTDVAVPFGTTVNTLRFNDTALSSHTLTVSEGDALVVDTGGILITSNYGNRTGLITGGTLTGGNPGSGSANDLMIINYADPASGSNSKFQIDSVIADNSTTSPGATALTKSGIGTLVLTNTANTYTGRTFLNSGITQIAADGSLGTLPVSPEANNITFTGGTLQFASSFNLNSNRGITLNDKGGTLDTNGGNSTYAGIVTGSGPLTKAGLGTLRITGENTSTGGTVVADGTLLANNVSGSATGTGVITVNSGATFGGTGTAAGTLVPAIGGRVAPGDSSVATLNVGGLTINNGSIFDLEFANETTYDQINVTGLNALTVNGGGLNLFAAGTNLKYAPTGTQTYNLFQYNGTLSGLPSNLSILNPQGGLSYAFGTSGGFLTLQISGTPALTSAWNTDLNNQNWSVAGNWTAGVPSSPGDTANFLSNITGPRTVNLDGPRTIGTLTFDSAHSYTIAPVSGGSLTLDNLGFAASVTVFNGSHTIAAPITLASNTAISIDNEIDVLTLSGNIDGAGTLTLSGNGTVVSTGTNSYAGDTTVGPGVTLQLGDNTTTGNLGGTNVANNGTLIFKRSDDATFNGIISGSGTLQFDGAGTTTLGGTNTYAGATTINAGTVKLGNSAALSGGNVSIVAGGVDVNGFSPTFTNLTGALGTLLDNTSASASTVTINNSAAVTFAGNVQNTGGGAVSIVKIGNGVLSLEGTNTYTGTTTINAGTLRVLSDAGLGDAAGTVTINAATLQFAGDATSSRPFVLGNAASAIQVDGGFTVTNTNPAGINATNLTKTGAGTLIVGGPLVLTNSPTITGGGTLAIGSPTGNVVPLTSPLAGGTFQIEAGVPFTLPAFQFGNATAVGGLRVNGGNFTATGTISLFGQNNTGSGNGGSITIESGSTTSFQDINSTNSDGALLTINGGNNTFGTVTMGRTAFNGDGTPKFTRGVIVNGGNSTMAGLTIGNANSSATMLMTGGSLNVTGPFAIARTASSRTSFVQVNDGTLTATDPNGLEMALVSGTSASLNVAGGTVALKGIKMFQENVAGSSATVTVGGGSLYIDNVGIQANLSGGSTSLVRLTGGILGATANWTSNASFTVDDALGPVTIQTADAADVPHDITLNGPVTGTNLTKTGGGTLTLNGTNGFGTLNLNAGNLAGNTDGLVGTINTVSAAQTVTINQGDVINGGFSSASVTGPASLVKTGSGTATLFGTNSYTGTTTISNGSLVLGTSGAISTTSKIVMAGGVLGTGGVDQTFTSSLALNADSAIDFGGEFVAPNTLTFPNSSSEIWTSGATLSIVNWSGTENMAGVAGMNDRLLVGAGGLSAAQLSQIHFAGFDGAKIIGGEVVPEFDSDRTLGDWSKNDVLDFADVRAMLQALVNLDAYKATFANEGDFLNVADANLSGTVTNADIQATLNILSMANVGSIAPVPEPASFVLLALGGVVLYGVRRRRAA